MKQGERYNTWKTRFFQPQGTEYVLPALKDGAPPPFCFGSAGPDGIRSNRKPNRRDINIHGYRVVADNTTNPGRYGFQIIHEVNQLHAFASDEYAGDVIGRMGS